MVPDPSLSDMAEYARFVWLATDTGDELERQALAWMIRNNVSGSGGSGSKTGDHCNPFYLLEVLWRGQDVLCKKSVPHNGVWRNRLPFRDRDFCRAFATVCLVWNGDLGDPTNGATVCHRHDQCPDWAAGLIPLAMIGAHVFYAPDEDSLLHQT